MWQLTAGQISGCWQLLALQRTSLSTFPQGSGSFNEEGTERMLEQEDGEGCYEMLSSGHGLAVEAMNSLKLWLPTEEQTNKIT